MSQTITPAADAHEQTRIAIVYTQWNPTIVDSLKAAAEQTCRARGVTETNIDCYQVPGAFEIPTLLTHLLGGGYDAIITLGAVIKGDTAHFEYVAGECARGIAELSRDTGVPIGFGVLATYNLEQALERAGPNEENKGVEAANAVLDMLNLLRGMGPNDG